MAPVKMGASDLGLLCEGAGGGGPTPSPRSARDRRRRGAPVDGDDGFGGGRQARHRRLSCATRQSLPPASRGSSGAAVASKAADCNAEHLAGTAARRHRVQSRAPGPKRLAQSRRSVWLRGGGDDRNRTGVHGFAIRRVARTPIRHNAQADFNDQNQTCRFRLCARDALTARADQPSGPMAAPWSKPCSPCVRAWLCRNLRLATRQRRVASTTAASTGMLPLIRIGERHAFCCELRDWFGYISHV